MKTCRWLAVAVMVGGLAGLAGLEGPALAQGKGKKGGEDAKADAIKDLLTAAEVAEFGRKHKAPEALIAAAGLLLRVDALTGGKLERNVTRSEPRLVVSSSRMDGIA